MSSDSLEIIRKPEDTSVKQMKLAIYTENQLANIIKSFQREDLVDYSLDLSDPKCQILETGIKETYAKYYICECDPERSNLICEKCFKSCHFNGAKFPHKEYKSQNVNAVCICGYKSHKPLYASEQTDKHYKVHCTFGEIGSIPDLNFSYQPKDETNTNVCILCYNICYTADKEIIKTTIDDLKGFKCTCKNHNHTDIRIIFRKLRSLAKKNNFLKIYNFEGLTFLHFINIFLSSKNTFYNLFHSFKEKIYGTNIKLQNAAYKFEDHNILNDLHLTSQVLSVFAQKCKNTYKIENKIIKRKLQDDELIEDQGEDEEQNKKQYKIDETIGVNGAEMEYGKVNLRNLCYINEIIQEIVNEKVFYKIMERKFDTKSRNIWQLKYYLVNIFYKFYLEKDFAAYPNFKISDIVLLSPIQRMLMVSSIETELKASKYVNNLNFNYVNLTLNVIEILVNTQEKSVTFLLILRNLYKICLKFAKFSLFNHEQLTKLCQLSDLILGIFDEEKLDTDRDFLKIKVLSPMIKTLVFLSFYYNDQLIRSGLNGERDVEKLIFFHGKNEICKSVSATTILILTFIQRFEDDVIDLQEKIEKKKVKRNSEVSDTINKLQELVPGKQYYIKSLRGIINNCNIILRMNLEQDDEYKAGLVRLIDDEQIIMFDHLRGNLLSKEKEFISRVRYFTEQIENNYYNYFQNYNSIQNEEKFTQKFEDIITEFNKTFVPITYNDKKKDTEENEELQNLKKDSDKREEMENSKELNNSMDENKNDKSAQTNPRYTIGFNNKYLVINSFFLQSMIKYIHVMYYSHISKKETNPYKFYIKQLTFKNIMEILYNFILKSKENSIFLLQSDFMSNFELLNDDQLLEAISLVNTAMKIVSESQREITSHKNILHLIKIAILKSSKIEVLDEILKLIQTLVQKVNFLHENLLQKKIMKIMKIIFNYHVMIKNYFSLMISSKKSDRLQCFKKETESILKKFMRIINSITTQKVIIEEKEFLDIIVSKDQLKKILYTKTINISLRTELIIYYRKHFLETILDKKDIKYYNSILINDFRPEKKDEIIENPKYFKFFEFLVKSGEYSNEIGLEKDANMIKFEMLNFQEVLTITTDKKKMRLYIESIIKCVVVYFNKFSSLIFDSSGYNCISLYEIVYYFLALKKYIYSRMEVFKNPDDNQKKILFLKKLNKLSLETNRLIHIQHSNEKEQKFKEKKDFATRFLLKEKKKMKNPKNEEEKIEFDMAQLSEENFEFLNYSKLRKIFLNHIKYFIKFPVVGGNKDYLEKKDIMYSEEKYEKYKAILKENGRMKNDFDDNCLKIIINYINMSCQVDKGTFIKLLSETNSHFNLCYRILLCKCFVFFYSSFHQKYKDLYLWFLYKLLQFDTTEIQDVYNEMEEQNEGDEPVFNFNDLIEDFTSSVMTIILREINFNGYENKNDYFSACMDIKLLKYFCEEHNMYFQTFFFNNEETSLQNRKDVLVFYKDKIKIKRKNKNISSDEPKKLDENNSEESEEEVNFDRQYNKIVSVFEYLLRVLGKIILLSHWMNNREENLDDYFYDIYFIILEFLIETIQGTSQINLAKVFTNSDKKSKTQFEKFLGEINHLLIDDSAKSSLNYIIRRDIMDFLMAFLEESATPPSGITDISSVLLPATILDSIIATMNKLFDEGKYNESKNNNGVIVENKRITDSDKNRNTYIKRNYKFTPEMGKYFKELYFSDPNFGEDEKFALANRMYQYFKMLGENTQFKNAYVAEFYYKFNMFNDMQVERAYYDRNYKLINKVTNAAITEAKFNDQFLCVSFFESITRTVLVKKENEENEVNVIFTLNPMVPLLSKISKEDFIDNVDRSDRYSKLVSLLDRCDNFFEEIKYRQQTGSSNCLFKFINNINFYILEVLAFFITLTINIIMLIVLNGEGDVLYGDNHINYILKDLGYANAFFNVVCIILWLIAKYNLLYMTECQKKVKLYMEQYMEEGEEREVVLSLKDKIHACFIVLVIKNKLFAFVWNIVMSLLAALTEIYFFYILQIFIIFNLSVTLRNLMSSVTLKGSELLSVFYLSVVVNLCLAAIAFYNFEEDFTKAIDAKMPHRYPEEFEFLNDLVGGVFHEPSHVESECATFAYCLATHMDYGMRFDGGIADRMSWRSFNLNKSFYMVRFVYEMIYFWSQTVMLQGMIFSIVIEAFTELRASEANIEKDKKEICFICGIDKVSCEKNGQKFEEHNTKEHNLWTYVDYILGLRFIDIQETNAINSYVMEKIDKKELTWFPQYKGNGESK